MKKKAVKTIGIIAAAAAVVLCAFWAKGYYNSRYVASDSFYTQIPADETNGESWLTDADGVRQEKGKKYDLIGYNEKGEPREVSFIKKGAPENYYAPKSYIKVNTSETIELSEEMVEEREVPQAALEKIASQGTRKK